MKNKQNNYLYDFSSSFWGILWEGSESFFNLGLKCLMVNVSCSWNDDVGTDVICSVELFNVFLSNWIQILSDTMNWLTHEMISISCVMGSFYCHLHLITVIFSSIVVNSFSFSFDLIFIVLRVLKDILFSYIISYL